MIDVPVLLTSDSYKQSHETLYPDGLTFLYSNLIPRKSRIKGIEQVVVFGIQAFIKDYLIERFNRFFAKPLDVVLKEYKRVIHNHLGPHISTEKVEKLHKLGYVPLKIKALPEGTLCPIQCPILTIQNTHPEFAWLTNFIETVLCTHVWQPITSATIAREYRKILEKYAMETVGNTNHVQWQGHDFSMRGLSSEQSCMSSGAGHLLSFTGSDTIPAILWLEEYYNADCEKELISGSVTAEEHSIACCFGKEYEVERLKRILKKYPTGIVSVIGDTWHIWNFITKVMVECKDEIMNRDGKVVCRPDSSPKTPVEIICGDPDGTFQEEYKGVVELLWDNFGGTINSLGYKELDSHVSCIYGDSISLEYTERICSILKSKGFASNNDVLGIGSYTYQYNTRDTFGMAMKATFGVVNGEEREMFKEPISDPGKKSKKGLLVVEKGPNGLTVRDKVSKIEEAGGELKPVFEDGKLLVDFTLQQVRDNVKESLNA